jgi:hypothetical protein
MRTLSKSLLIGSVLLGCGRSETALHEVTLAGEAQQVVAVVTQLFTGIETQDTVLLGQLLDPEVQLVSVRQVNGEPRWTRRTKDDFLVGIATNEATMVERMWDPEVRIDGDVATLWAPYDFHIDGEFSHCGYDGFHLVRQNGRWLISAVTYTVRSTGCEAAPPATSTEN